MANLEKDPRLYFKLPNDFHRHPKVRRLSDAAFRAFVEMIGEARIEDNDGIFPAEDAEFMWAREVLDELVSSHPSRPLVLRDGDSYVNRDYAKHQQTRADREEAARVARENGAKGGRPRKPKGLSKETQGVSDQNLTKPSGTQTKPESESESESELKTDLTSISSQSVTPLAVDNFRTDSFQESEEQIAGARALAATQKLDLEKIRQLASEQCARDLTFGESLRLGNLIVSKSRVRVSKPTAYVVRAFNEPFEVQQLIDREVRL